MPIGSPKGRQKRHKGREEPVMKTKGVEEGYGRVATDEGPRLCTCMTVMKPLTRGYI